MLTRRKFLQNLSMIPAATATSSLFGSFAAMPASAASTDGYRALVCVFLFGGMDGHDTIIPVDDDSWRAFSSIRSSLLDAYEDAGNPRTPSTLLGLSPMTLQGSGREFGLPSEMLAMHSLFEQGNAAIIANVGPLMERLDRAAFELNQVAVPDRLFSHNDQQSTWMSFAPEGARLGWGGRFGDVMVGANANAESIFSQISLAGNSVFLAGDTVGPYQIGVEGVPSIGLLEPRAALPASMQLVLRDHFTSAGADRSNLFERDFIDLSRVSFAANDLLSTALVSAPTLETSFPQSGLGAQLGAVARTISVRESLGATRQVFFVGIGGFDTHSGQATTLPALQRDIADSMAAFYAATVEMGIEADVTAFTASDFGRTLTVNGDGTDHGWGSHHFVVGGAVNGGDIYGAVPDAALGHDLDSGNGRLIPGLSVEELAAPLGRWFGLSEAELVAALPGLAAFGAPPIEFI